jgi:hypothetical protein
MKIVKYIIAMLYIALKTIIFLIGVIPIALINFSTEYPKEWYDMLFGSFYLGRNGTPQFQTVSDFVNYKKNPKNK